MIPSRTVEKWARASRRLAGVASLVGLVGLAPSVGQAAYAVKVTLAAPKGSSGEKPAAKYPTTTKTIPCDAPSFDAITMTVVYDATTAAKVVDRDVYLMLYSPEGVGGEGTRFFVMKKQNIGSSFRMVPRQNWSDIQSTDIYMPRAENLSPAGAVTEVLLSSVISVQGADAGIWQLVGIVADSATVSFNDPSTWSAWDVATIVLRKPWKGLSPTHLCD